MVGMPRTPRAQACSVSSRSRALTAGEATAAASSSPGRPTSAAIAAERRHRGDVLTAAELVLEGGAGEAVEPALPFGPDAGPHRRQPVERPGFRPDEGRQAVAGRAPLELGDPALALGALRPGAEAAGSEDRPEQDRTEYGGPAEHPLGAGDGEVGYAFPSWASNCNGAIDNAQAIIKNTLPGRLDSVNNAIKTAAPSAKVVVLDYPRLFNGEDCNALTFFSASEEKRLNETADLMKTTISAATTKAGANFSFGDVIPAFIGHGVCDGGGGSSTEWINGLSNPVGEATTRR